MTLDRSHYFDYAAATPVDPQVVAAMLPYFHDVFYNPSALYGAGQEARRALETARASVARVLGAHDREIVFTAGGTESTNLAIHGVMRSFPDAEVLVSAIEHDAVRMPARAYRCRDIPVDGQGVLDVAALQTMISDATVLMSVMHANNEVGTLQPIRQVTQLAERVRRDRKKRGIPLPLFVHTDACQTPLYADVHVARLGVDLMSLNGGKMYGPKQSGILYIARHVPLTPLITGGGQEGQRRSGTENVAFAVGFATALEMAQAGRRDRVARMTELRHQFLTLLHEQLPNARLQGSAKHGLPHIIHLTLPGVDNERIVFALDQHGIQVATGSACSASNDEPSHVLRAMGLDAATARASLRFSMGISTTSAAIETAVRTLAASVLHG